MWILLPKRSWKNMILHPEPQFQPIPVKAVIPRSLGTRSQRINPWIPADQPAATICKTDAGHELKQTDKFGDRHRFTFLGVQHKIRKRGIRWLSPISVVTNKEQPECPFVLAPVNRRHPDGLVFKASPLTLNPQLGAGYIRAHSG